MALMISLPIIAGVFGFGNEQALSENRVLAEAPEFSFDTIEEYPSKFEAYYNDNFPMRGYCVTAYNSMCYYLFKQGYNENLVIGDDNWIFYRPGYYENTYKRNDLLTDEELESIANYLLYYRDYCKKQGIEFYFVCPPDKSEVYPEKYPENIKQSGDISLLDQLEQYLMNNTDIKVINVKNALIDGKDTNQLYYSNGTHWNYYGSYIAYKEIMERIAVDFPEIEILSESDLTVVDDEKYCSGFYDRIVWDDFETWQKQKLVVKDISYVSSVSDEHKMYGSDYRSMVITKKQNVAPYKMLIYRDSFTEALLPYISSSIEDVTYLWKIAIDAPAIDAQKPDIFIYEALERHIPSVLSASKSFNHPVTINNKLVNSENMKICLDSVVESTTDLTIKGWSYIIDTDTRNQGKYIRFNFADGTSSDYKAQSYYSNIGDYFKNNKYDYARFSLSVRSEMFTSDIVSMQFIIEDNGQYYISTTIPFPEQGE